MHKISIKVKDLAARLIYEQVPAPMSMRFFSFIITGCIMIIIGIIFLLVAGVTRGEISAVLYPIVVGSGLILYGCLFKINLIRSGWEQVEGICVDHLFNMNFLPRKAIYIGRWMRGHTQGPDAIIIDTAQEVIYVQAVKKNNVPQVGCRVRLYVSKNAQRYSGTNGYIHIDPIFGYEVLPDAVITEKQD